MSTPIITLITTAVTDLSTQKYVPVLQERRLPHSEKRHDRVAGEQIQANQSNADVVLASSVCPYLLAYCSENFRMVSKVFVDGSAKAKRCFARACGLTPVHHAIVTQQRVQHWRGVKRMHAMLTCGCLHTNRKSSMVMICVQTSVRCSYGGPKQAFGTAAGR